MKCARCGAANPDTDAAVCSACGASLATQKEPRRKKREKEKHTTEQDPPGSSGLMPFVWEAANIGKRYPTFKTAPGEQHFLVAPMGQSIRLACSPGTVLLLGRDEDCDIRVSSKMVSRRHAELAFKGNPPRAFLKDLGTVNGTRVNDERISGELELDDKDLVRVGDVEATYRILPPGAGEASLKQDPMGTTAVLESDIPTTETSKFTGGLTGDIAFLPLADLFRRLGAMGASGTLIVESDGLSGRATFEKGAMKVAELGGKTGDEAVRAFSALGRGSFKFEPAQP
jgi:ribosomal protein L37E